MSIFIGFIVPFKPHCQSVNWENDCRLLRRTLECLINQIKKDYIIYVVYTDLPKDCVRNSSVKYIKYFEPFRRYEDIPNASSYLNSFGNETMIQARFDKGRKIMWGCKFAKENGCQYIMNVDADDLISNRLIVSIKEKTQRTLFDGWYIPRGYVWKDSSKIIFRHNQMQNYNGSTHIINSNAVVIPDFSSFNYQDYNLFVSHGWIRDRLRQNWGITLQPIAFRAVIYVAHSGNLSSLEKLLNLMSIKGILKILFRGRLLTKSIKKEFSIS